ncbi:MAG: copper amine oxidase N-terminal domain-containing protein [Deltaproteobacteria bacterium]
MFKSRKSIILITIIMLLFAAPASAATKVMLDGKQLSFDVDPVVYNGTTLVPLRAIFEAMGATVKWEPATQRAIATKGDTGVVLKIGSMDATINGLTQTLQVPAKNINGSTMAPLRFVGEAFGAKVRWDAKTSTANIYMNTAPPDIVSSDPLLDEDKIQKELTTDDIKRLNSYGLTAKIIDNINKQSKPEEKQTWLDRKAARPDPKRYRECLDIFQQVCTFDYRNLKNPDYREDFKKTRFRIGDRYYLEKNYNQYIDDIIKNQQAIKCYFLTSDDLIYLASPTYFAVRTKYIFYQSTGTKMVEEGSTLGKWYWRDIELYFVTPGLTCYSGNTTGIGYAGFTNLSDPKPYF